MPINIDHTGNLILTNDNLLTFGMDGAVRLPVGTIVQRPVVSDAGMIRYSTTSNSFEGFDGVQWKSFSVLGNKY